MWKPIQCSSQAGESAWCSGETCLRRAQPALVGLALLKYNLVEQPGTQDSFVFSTLGQPGRPPSVPVLLFATFEGQAQR